MLKAQNSGWLIAASVFLLAACSGGEQETQSAASNPCMAANPCNPCAAANPCNPCAVKSLGEKVTQGDRELNSGGHSSGELVAMGETLWSDKSLSSSGATSCSTCHVNGTGMMNASFAEPYPHYVAMAHERAGMDEVTAAEMVQLCMVIPMENEPLEWNSVELAALTSYVESLQDGYAANPCNPCAMNPCNPCAGANPCNPCGGGGGN
jgi:cytochrome c